MKHDFNVTFQNGRFFEPIYAVTLMTLPSGPDWDANVPAFDSVKAFEQCDRFIAHREVEAVGEIRHWGDFYLDEGQEIEMFDLLFASDALRHPLSPGQYRVQTLHEHSKSKGFAWDTYFSMISHADKAPDRWVKMGQYGADAYNMAVAPAGVGRRFREFREGFELGDTEEDVERWNLLVRLTSSYDEKAAQMVSESGIRLMPPGAIGDMVVAATSKIANLFVGYCGDEPVAIQGRWL